MAETTDLKSVQCGFESHRSYQFTIMKKYILLTTLVLTPFVEAQRYDPPPHSKMLIKPKMHIQVKAPAPSPLENPRVQDKLLSLFKSSKKNSR